MFRISSIGFACVILLAAVSIAHAGTTTIDFTVLAPGTAVTNQYAGVVFSLEGGPDSSGPPTTNDYGNGDALANSTNPDYPTANILDIAFASAVSGVSFTFDNWGDNGTTFYTAFDASDNVIDTGNISNVQNFALVTVAGSGIADLQINNGYSSSDNWYFAIQRLTYTPSASTPEPASLILLGAGLIGLVAWRKRKA